MDKFSLQTLENLLEKLVPLVDSAADKVRFILLIGLAVIVWLFIFMFILQGFSLSWAIAISVLLALPVLILLRFYLALEDLKGLPDLIDEITDDLTEHYHGLRTGKKANAVNAVSGAKDLWEIRKLLTSGREMIGDYVNIAVLANPLSLIFGVLSVIAVFGLMIVGIILGLVVIF